MQEFYSILRAKNTVIGLIMDEVQEALMERDARVQIKEAVAHIQYDENRAKRYSKVIETSSAVDVAEIEVVFIDEGNSVCIDVNIEIMMHSKKVYKFKNSIPFTASDFGIGKFARQRVVTP